MLIFVENLFTRAMIFNRLRLIYFVYAAQVG